MQSFQDYEKIKRFVILHKQFNANDGELTRTLKIRRKYVQEQYQLIIDDMYTDVQEVYVTDKLKDEGKEDNETIGLQVIQPKFKQEVA